MRFTKMHGAGNDFVVFDRRDGASTPSPARCRALADRHTGIGCDQILTIEAARDAGAIAAYGIFNSDGSRAGQCGNGARCVAAWLARDAQRRGDALPSTFAIDSPSGRHAVELLDDGQVRVSMGAPAFDPARIPLAGFNVAPEYEIPVDGRGLEFTAVSMGNPHAVIRVDDVLRAPVATLGAAVQRDAAFPDSVNVGFLELVDHANITLRVYERGVGETLACGSGACAAAAVAIRRGWTGRRVHVALPGGVLHIDWPHDDAAMTMAGPAAFVFDGDWIDD